VPAGHPSTPGTRKAGGHAQSRPATRQTIKGLSERCTSRWGRGPALSVSRFRLSRTSAGMTRLRAYFVEGASAEQVAQRFEYTRASVETLVRDYRAGRLELFASSRPGPRSEPKKDSPRTLILTLRREGRSLAQIARALTAAGTPLGRTAI
jgi:transposase-like protein